MNASEDDRPWHALEVADVLSTLGVGTNGLSAGEAEARLVRYGPNALSVETRATWPGIAVRQIADPMIYLLLAAAGISLAVQHYTDAGFILVVVVLQALVGFLQEYRAERTLAALSRMAAPKATVVRDGEAKTIDSAKVVPGDVVLLTPGDSVPADCRLIESNELQTDESVLTGESEPVTKSPAPVAENTTLAEQTDMCWASTSVTSGSGRAVVTATGTRTQFGRIAEETRGQEREQTPLQRRIHGLSKVLGVAGALLAVVTFGLGVLLRGIDALEMLVFAAAVAVAAIPEGLPAVITISLALGAQRMAQRNALIRRLAAVETLGSTTVICSDKTRTITTGEMTVTRLWAGGHLYEVTGQGFAPEGEIRLAEEGRRDSELPDAVRMLLTIGALANDARLIRDDSGWRIAGSPTEGAILVATRKAGIAPESLQREQARIAEIPFSSERKYMATLHRAGDRAILYVKGAPEKLIGFSTHILRDGRRIELTDEMREELAGINHSFARRGLRVLAGAYRELEHRDELTADDAEHDLTFAGMWGMLDPPRDDAIQAIEDAKRAGIHVVMLTGDNTVTAAAVAESAGIIDHYAEAIPGSRVEELPASEVAQLAMETPVFGRVSPWHKLKIEDGLKARGEIVAMTGDGVNDAPALKGASIGVAMGQAGKEVAREAADMVLLDDNFATIVHAIEEGRIIFSNIRRVVTFLFTTNLAEIIVLVGALLAGLPLPLTAIMVLWINFVTDTTCTIPLGVEPGHVNVLHQPPRPPDEPIVDHRVAARLVILPAVIAAGTLGLFASYLNDGSVAHARTVGFTTLAVFEWLKAISSRSLDQTVFAIGLLSNRWLAWGVGASVALQLAVIYTDFGRNVFGTTPLSAADWSLILPVAASVFVINESFKRFGVYDAITSLARRTLRRG